MEARYATRKQQLLAECQIAPAIFEQVLLRLTTFMAPFVETFCRQELEQHAHTYLCGLLSDVDRKISNRSRIALAKTACPCNASLAGPLGRIGPYARS